ncbi:MAG: 6,7-dimethyl-8-ribityllumazine synthase [bacterium]
MVNEVRTDPAADEVSVGIIQSEFNGYVTDRLRNGAVDVLENAGVPTDAISLYPVPGSFEIPGAASQVIQERSHDGIICLGSVVRGETPHFDYICSQVSRGISELSMQYDLPVIFGVLTTDTMNQALERAGSGSSNKGREAAESFLQTLGLYRAL